MHSISRPTLNEASSFAGTSFTQGSRRHRRRATFIVVAAVTTALVGSAGPAAAHDGTEGHDQGKGFKQVNLVSDIPKLASITDDLVKNPWGIDFGPDTPLWVNNQVTNRVTIYKGATEADPSITKLPLVVSANTPTGIVFNPTNEFQVAAQGGKTAKADFLFDENPGAFAPDPGGPRAEISGWSRKSGLASTDVKVTIPGNAYGGLTIVPAQGTSGPLLLNASILGPVDVYDGEFQPVDLGPDAFVDPVAKAQGIAPYNVQYLRGRVYVAYETSLSVFTRTGKLIQRIADPSLVVPWGMVIAPKDWGEFGGALLVGNVGDGMINAFNPRTGKHLGTLKDENGKPLVNPGLWGLKFGNGVFGTPQTLVFAAGIGEGVDLGGLETYQHGLIGSIEPVGDDDGHDDHGGHGGHGND